MNSSGILIYCEFSDGYTIRPIVKQLITKSCELKKKINEEKIRVCVIGERISYDEIIKELGSYGADEVIITSDDRLKSYDINYYPEIVYQTAKKYTPRIILIGATTQGKVIASYAAAKLDTGLTADCTNLDIIDGGKLLSTRPTFGGKLTADILCRTIPQMATVQENIFKEQLCYEKDENQTNVIHNAFAHFEWFNIDTIERKVEILNIEKNEKKTRDVTNSEIVVSLGYGACSERAYELANQLADILNGVTAGSRKAYEAGYITKEQQIGQTGKTIAPKLYIALGISGLNQHIAGIKNASTIIAVNKDENAPIFRYSDYGIKCDVIDFLEEIINKIENKKREKNEQ